MQFVIRRSANDDIDSMIRLILDVHRQLSPKEWFVVDEEAYTRKLLETGESWGYVAIDTENSALAGLFIANFPGMADHNLGRDINLPEELLPTIVHMDTAVVSPEYRGHHLQRRLMDYAEKELKAAGYLRLMCTVHPDNRFSLGSAIALNYRIIATKEKYGGYLRHVLLKEI